MSNLLSSTLSTTIAAEMEFNISETAYRRAMGHLAGYRDCLPLLDKTIPDGWLPKGEHCGIEFNTETPRTKGKLLADEIKALCAWAEENANGTRNCGVHIHLGMPGLGPGNYVPRPLLEFLMKNERFFMYLMPISRAFGYNPPWVRETYEIFARETGGGYTGLPSWTNAANYYISSDSVQLTDQTHTQAVSAFEQRVRSSRRWVTGITRHGTIEYRLMEGTKDANRVIGWIALLDLINRKFQNNELPDITTTTPELTRSETHELFQMAFNPPKKLSQWITDQYADNDFSHHAGTRVA